MAVYRYGNWIHRRVRIPIVSHALWFFYWVGYFMIGYVICGSQIPAKCTIGKGLKLPHPFGIFFTNEVVIGENCMILQQVTIGTGGREADSPVLEDNVFVGAGAKIIGKVRIGSNVEIGANAVVVNDVPKDVTAVGIPARILPTSTAHTSPQETIPTDQTRT